MPDPVVGRRQKVICKLSVALFSVMFATTVAVFYFCWQKQSGTHAAPRMVRVLIESPYAGDVQSHTAYAIKASLDALRRGEAPYASHLFFPQMLNDLEPQERSLGIAAGLAWGEAADKTVVYSDLGISAGMRLGIEAAQKVGRPVEYRRLF